MEHHAAVTSKALLCADRQDPHSLSSLKKQVAETSIQYDLLSTKKKKKEREGGREGRREGERFA